MCFQLITGIRPTPDPKAVLKGETSKKTESHPRDQNSRGDVSTDSVEVQDKFNSATVETEAGAADGQTEERKSENCGTGGDEGPCGDGERLHAALVMRATKMVGICAGLSTAFMLHRLQGWASLASNGA